MITIHDVIQDDEAWHKLRQEVDWTGSTAIYLLQGKKRPAETGISSRLMERGKALEPQALTAYKLETERDYMEVGFVTNNKNPKCGYSPDGISGEILLEVKCANGDKHRDLCEGRIPAQYIAQMQFGMMVCDLNLAQLIAYNPNDKEKPLVITNVPRDKKIITNIKNKLKEPN